MAIPTGGSDLESWLKNFERKFIFVSSALSPGALPSRIISICEKRRSLSREIQKRQSGPPGLRGENYGVIEFFP